MILLVRYPSLGVRSKTEAVLLGVVFASIAILAGGLLRGAAGGAEPLIAIFPLLVVAAVWGGLLGGCVMLVLGTLVTWYVYVGTPFSFAIDAHQAGSLLATGLGGALILTVSTLLRRVIFDLRSAHAAETELGLALKLQSAELARTLEEQRRAQQAVELSERQFRQSFEFAAVGKVQVEPLTGRILRVNQAFCDMLGYRLDELVGTDGWRLTFADDLAGDQEAYRQVLAGEAPRYIREKRFVRQDGSLVWGRVSLVVVRSPIDDAPVIAVGVVENIHEQRRYQNALERAKQELETTLAERTEALRQRALLLREVYHRVKNNLQVVDGLIMMQARLIDDPRVQAQLQQTRDRIFALGLVHHQLMGSDDLETFDVSPFLTQLVENLSVGSIAQQVRIEVHADPIKVDLDFAIPLGLVVTELVTNALKHAFGGRPGQIRIGLQKDPCGTVTLRLSDDGMGSRHPVAANDARPAGLGMKIVEGLLGQMRGKLHVDDAVGTGYRIVFPQGEVHERAQ